MQARASRLSFTDILKRLAAVPNDDPVFIGKQASHARTYQMPAVATLPELCLPAPGQTCARAQSHLRAVFSQHKAVAMASTSQNVAALLQGYRARCATGCMRPAHMQRGL